MLNDCITVFVFIKGCDKAADVSMGNIKEFVDFEAKFKEDLIFSVENFLFHVVILVGVEFQLLDWPYAFIHLKISK
jgi:hypothetical protein